MVFAGNEHSVCCWRSGDKHYMVGGGSFKSFPERCRLPSVRPTSQPKAGQSSENQVENINLPARICFYFIFYALTQGNRLSCSNTRDTLLGTVLWFLTADRQCAAEAMTEDATSLMRRCWSRNTISRNILSVFTQPMGQRDL